MNSRLYSACEMADVLDETNIMYKVVKGQHAVDVLARQTKLAIATFAHHYFSRHSDATNPLTKTFEYLLPTRFAKALQVEEGAGVGGTDRIYFEMTPNITAFTDAYDHD